MIKRETTFSDDRVYRFTLWRQWEQEAHKITEYSPASLLNKYAMFIGLNPSTADETLDDPTIRRCIAFSKRWGYGALCMTNLFAFRTVSPKVMKAASEPIGDRNDEILMSHALEAGVVVAAWGINGTHRYRNVYVKRMMKENGIDLMCLRLTKAKHPEHPLYVPAETQLIPFPMV